MVLLADLHTNGDVEALLHLLAQHEQDAHNLPPPTPTSSHGPVHFFVSYARPDQPWVEWIAWELEEAVRRSSSPSLEGYLQHTQG